MKEKKFKIYYRKTNTYGTPLLNLCESTEDRMEREDNVGEWGKYSLYKETAYKKVRDRWFNEIYSKVTKIPISKESNILKSTLDAWNSLSLFGKIEYQIGELIKQEDIKVYKPNYLDERTLKQNSGTFTFTIPYQL